MLKHALHLASLGFWVFPIVAGKKAPPVFKRWQHSCTRDEDTIREHWELAPNDNIGISTSKFGDDGQALVVVDVDVKKGKNGFQTLLEHELAGRDLTPTLEQRTPSGGMHYVYVHSSGVRQGVDVLGRGLDIRSTGGFIVGAGSTVEGGDYSISGGSIAPVPAWVVERCGVARERAPVSDAPSGVDSTNAIIRATHYLRHEAPLAVEGEGGDEVTYKVACRLKDLGVEEMTACVLIEHEWNDRCSPPWSTDDIGTKVHNAYAYGRDAPGVSAPEAVFPAVVQEPATFTNGEQSEEVNKLHPFATLNKEFAFVIAGGGDHILWETTDSEGKNVLSHLSANAFHNKFASWEMTFGKKTAPITKEWMRAKNRRSYDGICFAPGLETPARFYNLWRGFSVTPAATQEANDSLTAFLTHARDNVCHADPALYRWLIGYFAHLVQRPWEKPLVALVFRGGKGVGKNALVERIGGLLGSHFILTSNRRYLIGNFNGHLENLLMFALDEAFWSGDKQAEGQLKDLITGKEHVIEHKGKEPYTVANRTRVAIIGNENWLVPSSHDERRFAVFDVGDGRKQDRSYFQSMREGMEAGGYAALLRYLLDFDIAGIDVNEAPATAALLDQKHASLEPVEQWWLDCISAGAIANGDFESAFGGTVECSRLRDAFRRYHREKNIRGRVADDRTFGKVLKKVCGGMVAGKQRQGGNLVNVYKLPGLVECRAAWDTFIGHSVEWATEE